MNKKSQEKGKIIIYSPKNEKVMFDVKLYKNTVWLSLNQIADLFQRDKSVISKHIDNIYIEKELPQKPTVAKFATVQKEGERNVVRKIEYFNLDLIISVGYRVNSKRGVQFRIWATNVLKTYLVKGYVLNEKRLKEQQKKFNELKDAIKFIQNKSKFPELVGKETLLLNLIDEYADSLSLLHQYDKDLIKTQKIKKPKFALTYENCQNLINDAKKQLAKKQEATSFFGQETGGKFESILGTIYQTFEKQDLYATLTEKAAHLFYLTIKDHPFTDGNKRLASLLLLYFLEKNNFLRRINGERKIDNGTIVALSLLIANSNPKEKETMIKIITNLLKE